ncbi:MAG: 6-phosphofructokinase, partial [Myxococcota bacterium]
LDEDVPGVEVRETILGHVVRGGNPSATDRVIAQRLGLASVLGLEAGHDDVMYGWDVPEAIGTATSDPAIRAVGLAEMLRETERLISGESPVTKGRIALLESAERLLAF